MRKPKRRFVPRGQQKHHRYGWITIEYACLTGSELVIGWSCAYGYGQLSVRQNYTAIRNEGVSIIEPNAYTFTPQPGIHLDTEAMGPEFVGEVMKALYWAGERGEVIPENPIYE